MGFGQQGNRAFGLSPLSPLFQPPFFRLPSPLQHPSTPALQLPQLPRIGVRPSFPRLRHPPSAIHLHLSLVCALHLSSLETRIASLLRSWLPTSRFLHPASCVRCLLSSSSRQPAFDASPVSSSRPQPTPTRCLNTHPHLPNPALEEVNCPIETPSAKQLEDLSLSVEAPPPCYPPPPPAPRTTAFPSMASVSQ